VPLSAVEAAYISTTSAGTAKVSIDASLVEQTEDALAALQGGGK
jgi:hypothetical protein